MFGNRGRRKRSEGVFYFVQCIGWWAVKWDLHHVVKKGMGAKVCNKEAMYNNTHHS
jgi:hypothetical protein